MKRIVIFILILISVNLYSEAISTQNLTIIEEIQQDNIYKTLLIAENGIKIEVESTTKLSQENYNLIDKTYLTFFNWDELTIKESRIIFNNNRLSIILIPESFMYNEVDISEFLPSGIQIYYSTFYEFDFRMFKDTLFMRIKGQFYSKDEFLKKVYKAVDDPLLYVQIHDPSYLIRQIDALRAVNSYQESQINELIENLTLLSKKNQDLLASLKSLSKKHEELTYSIVSLDNRSFFGALEGADKNTINTIIELKQAEPNSSVKDISNRLKAKSIKVSVKVIESTFVIFFNEYPQN